MLFTGHIQVEEALHTVFANTLYMVFANILHTVFADVLHTVLANASMLHTGVTLPC